MQLRTSCFIWAGLTPLIAWSDKHAPVAFCITLAICSSIDSFLSSTTPRTFTLFWGVATLPPKCTGWESSGSALLVKWIRLVLSASNMAPLCFTYRSVCGRIDSWIARMFYALSLPTTYILKSSTKPSAPPLLSI
jgi:hypothetical protein